MPQSLPFDPVDGARVQIGVDGPRGHLIRCHTLDGSGFYFKVKLDSGEWVWPDHVIAESSGPFACRCLDCRIPFQSTIADARTCPICVGEITRQHGDPGSALRRKRR